MSSSPENAVPTGPTKPRVFVPDDTDPSPAQSGNPSNPVKGSVVQEVLPPKPAVIPLPQQMADLRDRLVAKYPKSAVTIRLDITSTEDSGQFTVYCDPIPNTPGGAPRHGRLGIFPTIVAARDAVILETTPPTL